MTNRNPGKVRRKWAPTFSTGIPCKNGHLAPRLVSNKCCVECVREQDARRYAKNPEKAKSVAKRWRDNNPEKAKALSKKWFRENPSLGIQVKKNWRIANKEKIAEQNARWYREHPFEARELSARKRAMRISAGGHHTAEQLRIMFAHQNGKCAACRKSIHSKLHVDHIMPVAKGGSNDISNIQLLCPSCNQSKHAKDPFKWAQENGRLL